MMEDYSITWKYLIDKMKEKYGINPDSTERYSFGEIEYKLECIRNEHFNKLREYYATRLEQIVKKQGVRP